MAPDRGSSHSGSDLQPGLIMISNHAQFLDAIRDQKMVRIAFYSKPDDGTVDRECAPLDYGSEPGGDAAGNRYWIWDQVGSAGTNPLGLLPGQIVSVNVLGRTFDPRSFNLGHRSWFVPRPWDTNCEAPAPGVK